MLWNCSLMLKNIGANDIGRDKWKQVTKFLFLFELSVACICWQMIFFIKLWLNLPLLLFLVINVQHQIVEYQVKTRQDVYEEVAPQEINHMVGLLNQLKSHLMFHLLLKHRHQNLKPEMHATEKKYFRINKILLETSILFNLKAFTEISKNQMCIQT